MTDCNLNKTHSKDVKYPFTNDAHGFQRIGLVGYHTDAFIQAFDISTYLEYSTIIIASPNIDTLPNSYIFSRVQKVVFVKSRDINDIRKIIDSELYTTENVVTIYETSSDTDNINIQGNLICIYDSYVKESINTFNIVISKLCSNKIRKKIHKYCSVSQIKLLGFDSWSRQLSEIHDDNIMVLNNNGLYECNFTGGLVGSLLELDTFNFKVTPLLETFDKIDKTCKSIVFCGRRGSGLTSMLRTYIKHLGNKYDKCMFACSPLNISHFKNSVLDTGCSFLSAPDINEIINFVKASGNKLLILNENCAQEGNLLKLYNTLVCNRHLLNLTIIMTCQYANSKITKLNHDHFVIFTPHNMTDHKRLFNLIGNYYPSFDLFKRDVEYMGQNPYAMVVNNIDNKNYRDKTFNIKSDDYLLLDNIGIKFTPHELLNKELSVTWTDTKNTDSDICSEWPIILPASPLTLLTGPLDKCFRIFNSYSNHINNMNHSDNNEYLMNVKSCHIFVSPDTDNKIIEEFENANYCVHYGYNIDELREIKTKYLDIAKDKQSTLHICIVTSFLHECARRFLKNIQFQDIIFDNKFSEMCVTVIEPIGSNILSHVVSVKFDLVVTTHTANDGIISELITNYFPSIRSEKFADMINNLYSDDTSELKILSVVTKDDSHVQILKISEQPLNKFTSVPICSRKTTNSLEACFVNLAELN